MAAGFVSGALGPFADRRRTYVGSAIASQLTKPGANTAGILCYVDSYEEAPAFWDKLLKSNLSAMARGAFDGPAGHRARAANLARDLLQSDIDAANLAERDYLAESEREQIAVIVAEAGKADKLPESYRKYVPAPGTAAAGSPPPATPPPESTVTPPPAPAKQDPAAAAPPPPVKHDPAAEAPPPPVKKDPVPDAPPPAPPRPAAGTDSDPAKGPAKPPAGGPADPVPDPDAGQTPAKKPASAPGSTAAEAIPNTSFHGANRPASQPTEVQAAASASFARQAARMGAGTDGDAILLVDAKGVERRVRIITEPPTSGEKSPVAHFRLPDTGDIVIIVSDRAADHHIERAVAHELAEINHRLRGGKDGPDALAPGSTETELSAHDVGRLAELEVMTREIREARKARRAADKAGQTEEVKRLDAVEVRLKQETRELAVHLGLTGTDNKKRLELAREASRKAGRRDLGDTIDQLHEIIGKAEWQAISDTVPKPSVPRPRSAEVEELAGATKISRDTIEDLLAIADQMSPEERAHIESARGKAERGEAISADEVARLRLLAEHTTPADPEAIKNSVALGKAGAKSRRGLISAPLGPDSAILDSNAVIALAKPADQRSPAEQAAVAALARQTDRRANDYVLAGEPDPAGKPARPVTLGGIGGFPVSVSRDSPEYQQMVGTLVRYSVGTPGGHADRTIVADAFFARTTASTPPAFHTGDKAILNGLLRASGQRPETLTENGTKSMHEVFPDGFTVTLYGRTLKVVPLPSEP